MKRMSLVLVVLLAFAVPAAAQAPSAARMEAAEELLEVMGTEKTMKETADAILAVQLEADPEMAKVEDIMADVLDRVLDWDALRDTYVELYAETYTEAELRQLQEFYQTPLGRRLVATQPMLAVRSQQITNDRMQQFLPELQQRIMERMLEEGAGGAGPEADTTGGGR